MVKKVLTILGIALLLAIPEGIRAQASRNRSGAPLPPAFANRPFVGGRNRPNLNPSNVLPPPRLDLPLYNPYFSIYFGPLYEPYDEPCYYDEEVGQWIGPCNTSLSTPGFSRTVVPRKFR